MMTDSSRANLTVKHPGGAYPIVIGDGVLSHTRTLLGAAASYVVVTDENVGPHYAGLFADPLAVITLPAGEQHKTLDTIRTIYTRMLEVRADRGTWMFALGGGVIGDMTGFAAATFMRGIPFVQCPTSLLAMVDASVGGKTGVDLPEGKNLVGAFKQPVAVLIDSTTLATLPESEFAAGMAEVIKHGIIADPMLFELVGDRRWRADTPGMKDMLRSAIEVKRQIVEEDPYEHGRRALLNLGHTFGHAIEHVSRYRLRHGEAVAIGMVVAARVAEAAGVCDPKLVSELESALSVNDLPARIPADLPVQRMIETMWTDKKKQADRLRFVLPVRVGQCEIRSDIPLALVDQVMNDMASGPQLGA